jgi:hypothetical protein
MPQPSIAEINRRNREFWDAHQFDVVRLSSDELCGCVVGRDGSLGTERDVTGCCGAGPAGPAERSAYLEQHPITQEIRRRGARNEHLEAIRFSSFNRRLPFDRWSVIGGPVELPVGAIAMLKAYCALKWLVIDDPGPSQDRDDAWRLVAETMVAPVFATGMIMSAAQRARAKRPRGRTEDGRTIREIIGRLVSAPECRDASVKELWPQFFSTLEVLDLGPEEVPAPRDRNGAAYRYDARGSQRRITFGRFATIISELRREKSR